MELDTEESVEAYIDHLVLYLIFIIAVFNTDAYIMTVFLISLFFLNFVFSAPMLSSR